MARWEVASGSGAIALDISLVSQDAGANVSVVRITGQVRAGSSATFFNDPRGWSTTGVGARSGTWTHPSGSGTGWRTIVQYDVAVGHAANGTCSVTASFAIAATGTSGLGGPTSTGDRTLTLPTIVVKPNPATGMTAKRLSDTQVQTSWTRNYPSNGVPSWTAVQASVNGGAWADVFSQSVNIAAVVVATAPNRSVRYRVGQGNSAGSAWSAAAGPVFTTPATPTNVAAVKSASAVTVSWVNKVGFAEYRTEVWHGAVGSGGAITWDTAPLATVAAGVTSFAHESPSGAEVHVYRVRAANTSGGLVSGFAQSNTVQVVAPPNAPTLSPLPTWSDRAASVAVAWTHNPVDTSEQRAREFSWSTDGGTTWQGAGKVNGSAQVYNVAAGTFAAGVTVMWRVRTWGAATTGGSDGTGASPWSATVQTTFTTRPAATITQPGDTVEGSSTVVQVGFAQGQGASLVRTDVTLSLAGQVVETARSTTGTVPLTTRLVNGGLYTLTATVLDSHGLTSAPAVRVFAVDYPTPQAAQVDAQYLPESGATALDLGLAGTPGQVLRRNMICDPRATSAARWSMGGTGVACTEQMVTGATDGPILPDGTQVTSYARYTVTAGPAGDVFVGATGETSDPPSPIVPVGASVAVAVYVRSSVAIAASPRLNRGLDGANLADTDAAAPQPIPAGEWVCAAGLLVGNTIEFNQASGNIRIPISYAVALVPGTVIEVTAAMVEPGVSAVGDFFDGSIRSDDPVIEYRWIDTPNMSPSIEAYRAAPATVSVERIIAGARERVVDRMVWDGSPVTLLDTTPVTNGTNVYEVTTYSAEDAAAPTQAVELHTADDRWAFFNRGPGYQDVVRVYAGLTLEVTPVRESALVQAAGRARPIALFGDVGSLEVAGKAVVLPDEGSTVAQIEEFLLTAGRVCYRDPSGRRMFGRVTGQVSGWTGIKADLSYTVSEAD